MEFKKKTGRIWLEDPSGQEIAFVAFPAQSEGTVTITSTYVSPVLRGQGVAAALMEALAEELRATGQKVTPVCSYAVRWFEQHPEQADLLAGER